MKFDLEPIKRIMGPIRPLDARFDVAEPGPDEALDKRMWRPILIGCVVVGVFVFGMLIWAAFAQITSAASAPAEIRVEASRKTLRHREGGVVSEILVREGQRVAAGQSLLRFDAVQADAAVDVLQNQYDAVLAQSARFTAESVGARTLVLPPELTERMSDPRVAGLLRDQQLLFNSRLQFFLSQESVLGQRVDQLATQMVGVQAQLDSVDEQIGFVREELAGYQTLYEKGYAPKTLILRYERSLAELGGRRGALTSELNRLRQAQGEARMQLTTLRNQRISEAAEGLRQMQTQLSDVGPRLTAARQVLDRTNVTSPVDGYVLNLTQFTVGGVVTPGELLMDVVPADAPLIVHARVAPKDIDSVTVGQAARVEITAFARRASPLEATVTSVSADRLVDEAGVAYFLAELRIDPADLAKLPEGAALSPGMPARAMIVTGRRSVLDYMISPLTDTFGGALREE
ncbi:MAG: HlyD family type I secretion periplasmic adaptor subunit [Phenylobacterium sp.]|uniref:HlyD family type I secretion periplasmic adaptor subunit n=1 Tax=Phenylobacterium sp. TaxID=1871053 RepID=UPI0027186BA2|nr:HlyD family type I secretion periplasmic adaptor subunit [Phenylobacterium sp.]MDO8900633.1 HlyD family type I secretion periplasmic adaptor subunit [Phenylobacterium sp.]